MQVQKLDWKQVQQPVANIPSTINVDEESAVPAKAYSFGVFFQAAQ